MSAVYIVLVCLVAVSLGGDVPSRCCISDRNWEAVMTNTSQINMEVLEYSIFYVDYGLKKDVQQHMYMKPGSPPAKLYRLVHDYNKKKIYVITENGNCTAFPNTMEMIAPCIDMKATYLGSSYVGYKNPGQPFDAWRWTTQNINITITVTPETCVPVLEGVNGPGIDVAYFFSGYKTPISDMSVFDVPAGC